MNITRSLIMQSALYWRKASRADDVKDIPALKAKFYGRYDGLRSALQIIRENER